MFRIPTWMIVVRIVIWIRSVNRIRVINYGIVIWAVSSPIIPIVVIIIIAVGEINTAVKRSINNSMARRCPPGIISTISKWMEEIIIILYYGCTFVSGFLTNEIWIIIT
jgi:hypothetical protein